MKCCSLCILSQQSKWCITLLFLNAEKHIKYWIPLIRLRGIWIWKILEVVKSNKECRNGNKSYGTTSVFQQDILKKVGEYNIASNANLIIYRVFF